MRTRFAWFVLNTTLVGVSALFIAGCSKPQSATGNPPPGITVGTEIDDSVITTKVKSALMGDPDVKGLDFKVETRKGEVQLSGFVDNQGQIDRAIVDVHAVAGVKSVDNKLALKTATSLGTKVDDSVVTTQVKAALLNDLDIKSFDIAVVTRNGEVQLSGFVDNQGQMDRAVNIARAIEGVASVSNKMSIKK